VVWGEIRLDGYSVERISTGILGLDEMLRGGIPRKSIILLCGGPGAGKTIITLQYTMAAIERGEPVVYVSLEESLDNKIRNAAAFGWDLSRAEEENLLETRDIFLISHSQGVVEPFDKKRGKIQFSLENEIETAVKRINAKHIILDPLTSILVHESRSGKKRFLISQLFDTIRALGCTALLTSEGLPSKNDFYMEEFLADGVILLEKTLIDFKLIKTLRIDKMRGIGFDDQPRRYVITSRGFQVLHSEPVLV